MKEFNLNPVEITAPKQDFKFEVPKEFDGFSGDSFGETYQLNTSEYTPYIQNVMPSANLAEQRALGQSNLTALGVGISKALITGVGELLASPGYAVAALDVFKQNEADFSNAWTKFFGEGSQELASTVVGDIYQTQATQDAIFDPLNLEWWGNTAEQLGSTIGLMAASYFSAGIATPAILNGLGKLGKAGQYINKARKLVQSNEKLNKFLNTTNAAVSSRILESTMESHQSYEQNYNRLVEEGLSEEEAKLAASKAARNTYISNLPLVISDYIQYDLIFNNFGKLSGLTTLGAEAFSEGTEEALQFSIQENASNKADIFAGLSEDETSIVEQLIGNLDNPELQKAFVQGAVGGTVFNTIGQLNKSNYNKLRNNVKQVVNNSLSPQAATNNLLVSKPKQFISNVATQAKSIINNVKSTPEQKKQAEIILEKTEVLSDPNLDEAKNILNNTSDTDSSEATVIEDTKDEVNNENLNSKSLTAEERIKKTVTYKTYKIEPLKNETFFDYIDRAADIVSKRETEEKKNNLESIDNYYSKLDLTEQQQFLEAELGRINTDGNSVQLALNNEIIKQASKSEFKDKIVNKYNKLNSVIESSSINVPEHIKPKVKEFAKNKVEQLTNEFKLAEQNKLSEQAKLRQAEEQIKKEKNDFKKELKTKLTEFSTPEELNNNLEASKSVLEDMPINEAELQDLYNKVKLDKVSEEKVKFQAINKTDVEQVEEFLKNNKFYAEFYLDKFKKLKNNPEANIEDLAKAIVEGNIKTQSQTEIIVENEEVESEIVSYTKEDYVNEIREGKSSRIYEADTLQNGNVNNFEDGVYFKYDGLELVVSGAIPSNKRKEFSNYILNNPTEFIIYNTKSIKPLHLSNLDSVRSVNSNLEVNANNEVSQYFNYNEEAINNLEVDQELTLQVQENDFTDKAEAHNLPIEIVNENGNVVGMVKSLDYRIDESKSAQLKEIRDIFNNNKDTKVKVKITDLYTGRYNNTPEFVTIDQLPEDTVYGVAIKESNADVSIVHQDTNKVLLHPNKPKSGAIYAYIKNIKGNYDAVRLFTKQLINTPQYNEVQKLLLEFETKPSNKEVRRKLQSLVRFKDSQGKYLPDSLNEVGIKIYTELEQAKDYNIGDLVVIQDSTYKLTSLKNNTGRFEQVNNNVETIENGQILELELTSDLLNKHWVQNYIDTYNLQLLPLQIDYKQLDNKTYFDSVKDRLETNINPIKPFYGVKFEYEYIQTVEEEKVIVEEVKTKPKKKSRFDRKSKTNETTRFKVVGDTITEFTTSEEEIAYFKSKLPNVPIHVLDSMRTMKEKFGQNAYGAFSNSAVYIVNSPIKGTAAHEAFEVVFSTLDTKQQNKLLKWAKNNRTKEYKHDDIDFLADTFMDYVNNIKPKSITQSIRNIFNRLLEFVKSVFNYPLTTKQIFNKIQRGGYKDLKLDNYSETRFKRTELPPLLEQQVIDVATRHIQKQVEKYIENNNLDSFNNKDLVKAYQFFINPNREDILTTEKEYYEQDYIPFIDVLAEAYKNSDHADINTYLDIIFDALTDNKILYNKIVQNLYKKGINITFELNKDDYLIDDAEQSNLESWQVTTQINPFTKLSAKLRSYLDSVYIVESINSKGEVTYKTDDVFNFKQTFDGYALFKKLGNILANIHNIQDIIPKLENYTKYEPSIELIIKDLKEQPSLLKEFFKGIVNYKEDGKIAIQTKVKNKSKVNLISINRNTLITNIVDNLYSGFIINNAALSKDGNYDAKGVYETLDIPLNIPKANSIDLVKTLSILAKNGLVLPSKISKEDIVRIRPQIKQFLESSDPFKTEAPRKIAEKLSSYYNLYQDSYTKSSGKGGTVQSYRASNYIRKLISKIKDGSLFTNSKIYENLNNLLVKEFKNNKNLTNKLELVELTEFKPASKSKAVSYNDFSDYDSYMAIISSFIANNHNNDTVYVPLSVYSDAPVLNALKLNKLTKEQALEYLEAVYLDEVSSIIKHVKNLINKQANGKKTKKVSDKNKEELGINKNLTKGEVFYLFPYMNKYLKETPKNEEELKKYGEYLENLNVKKLADKFLQQEFVKVLNKLKQLDIINVDNTSDIIQSDQPITIIEEAIYNLVAYQSSIIPITQGDLSFYKDIADFFKRAKEIYSPGQYNQYLENEQEYRYNKLAILQDLEEASDHLETIAKFTNEKNSKRFKSNESTDAQSFIDLLAYKKRMIGDNRWTKELQEEYEKMLNLEDSNLDIEVVKPFYYNLEYDKIKGAYPLQLKMSEFVWTPKLANLYGDKNIMNMFKKMSYTVKNNKIQPTTEQELKANRELDQVIFTSGVKAEVFNVVNHIDNVHNYDELKTLDIDLTEWRRQQETPVHHKDYESTFGTQTMKLIIGDVDYDKDYNGKTGKQLIEEYNSLIIQDVNNSFDNIKDKFNSIEDLVRMLKEEVIKRGLGDQYLEALEMTYDEALDFNLTGKDNTTKLPLWHPLHTYRIQAIANSIFKNNVSTQKLLRGVALINQSDYGFNKRPEIKFNENGIEYFEAYAPIYSEELLDPRYVTDGLPDVKKIEKLNPNLLKGIVYRIPTEDKYSMFQVKIIGFLPNAASIVLPKEAPTIAGLDFDIDKVFGFFRHSKPDSIDTDNNADIAQYYAENKGKIISDNAKFDIMYSILQHSASTQLSGGNYDTINKVLEEDILPNIKVDNIDNYSSLTTMVNIIRRMNMGKALIGPAANFNAMHSQWQHSNLFSDNELKLNISFKFNNYSYDLLSNKLDSNEKEITKNIAEQLAAVVDNGKDPKAEFFNLNLYTTDVFNSMLAVGVPLREAMLFIAQPKIKQFVQDYYNKGGNFQAEAKVKQQYNVSGVKISTPVESFTTEQLLEGIKNNKHQDELLTAFIVYKKVAEEVSNFLRASKMGDSSAGPTVVDNQLNINSVNKDSKIEGSNTFVEGKGFMNTLYKKGIKEAQDILIKELGLPQINNSGSLWYKLYEYFTNLKSGFGLTTKEYTTIINNAYHYLATDFEYFNFDENIVKNTHTKLAKVKQKDSKYKLFLDQLHIEEDTNYIQWRKPLDKYEMDTMRELWEDMLVNGNTLEQELASDLIKYSFYNSGFSVKPNSFAHMQPVSFYANVAFKDVLFNDLMKQGLNEFNTSIAQLNNFINQYIRNNFKAIQLPRAVVSEKEQNVTLEIKNKVPSKFRPRPENYAEFMDNDGEFIEYAKLSYEGEQYLGHYRNGEYIIIQALGNNNFLEYSYGKINLESKLNPKVYYDTNVNKNLVNSNTQLNLFEEVTNTEIKSINIYAGTKENIDLSNFAIRPFTTNVEYDNGNKEIKFQSVEQGFHYHKALLADKINIANKVLKTTNGGTLKSLTSRKNMSMSSKQVTEWDAVSKSIMLNLMYDSFIQNPKAAQRLINTGNAKITHTQDKTRWRKDFPEVVETVREMLKEELQDTSNTLWENNKDILLKANPDVTKESFLKVVDTKGLDYVKEYIKKCKQ